ncbi:hypothetical protein AC622_03185 [Bacillus sp. FJAT-27916]|nr:hypothetical protein AC622_03185 [Bacillus sp. FJAT-27916]
MQSILPNYIDTVLPDYRKIYIRKIAEAQKGNIKAVCYIVQLTDQSLIETLSIKEVQFDDLFFRL